MSTSTIYFDCSCGHVLSVRVPRGDGAKVIFNDSVPIDQARDAIGQDLECESCGSEWRVAERSPAVSTTLVLESNETFDDDHD